MKARERTESNMERATQIGYLTLKLETRLNKKQDSLLII